MKLSDNFPLDEETSHIQQAITLQASDRKLDCLSAFGIASELNVSPLAVGRTLDQMGYRITHCQLGLFGHLPQKKVVSAENNIDFSLKTAIEAAANRGPLPCSEAWNIAARFDIPKISVSNACEGLGIKISPCQLGAF